MLSLQKLNQLICSNVPEKNFPSIALGFLLAEFYLLQGLNFEVVVSSFAEDLDKNNFEHPFEYAKETARKKTLQVATQLQNEKVR